MRKIKLNEIILTADLAHFKNSTNGKNQDTFDNPPPSTIIGMLKNIYGEDIKDFVFGYICEFEDKFKDVATIYKEIKAEVAPRNKRFKTDICFVEYLVNPKITIYTNINKEPIIDNILNLGKTNCLAKCVFNKVTIIKDKGVGYNQWTPINIGCGVIKRINKETIYNSTKGFYDYYTTLARFNNEFESDYTIEESNEGIFLWEYKGVGDVRCYQGNI